MCFLEHLLSFLKTSEVCVVGNKGANITNHVDLSGIYSIRDIVYVFQEVIVNPLGLLTLGSNWRLSIGFIVFGAMMI